MKSRTAWVVLLIAGVVLPEAGQSQTDVTRMLTQRITRPLTARTDIQAYIASRVATMPEMKTLPEWESYAAKLRRDTLEGVIFRGEAAAWRAAKTKVEWLGTIEGGPGYHIKKLRYEVVPGLWVPALLYEPDDLGGKVPVVMNTTGHETGGKAVAETQVRGINQAKRGMLALSVDWFGTGDLRGTNYLHNRMPQLDLCGTSGVALFYLALQRGLDVLLSLPHADPERVAVTGLSGGGWQAIIIGALDPRVTLANPVAGYSSFRTHTVHSEDLGDAEQSAADLASMADYTHLTALRAPRPTLLTYNARDNCCFRADYAMPPLVESARPVFALYGDGDDLRTYVQQVPGTHHFGADSREALYRMFKDYFYAGNDGFVVTEIASEPEIKRAEALRVELPAGNADFNSLARSVCTGLPRTSGPPSDPSARSSWTAEQRRQLREIVRFKDYQVAATPAGSEPLEQGRVERWELRIGETWTVPAVALTPAEPHGTVILVGDGGRPQVADQARALFEAGTRVLAVDPLLRGELSIKPRGFKFAMLLSAVGDRAIGIQASQIAAIARWAKNERGYGAVKVVAVGRVSSLYTLIAAALEPDAISGVELYGGLASLREVITGNMTVRNAPELFCFGLLEHFDVPQLAALVAPRPVETVAAKQ